MGSLIASQAISEMTRSINRDACQKLQLLLETKHIYQRVLIEADQIAKEITGRVLPDGRYDFDIGARLLRTGRFTLAQSRGPVPTASLTLLVQNVKIFCPKCGSREVFSPLRYEDVTNQLAIPTTGMPHVDLIPGFQLFYLTYQCQRCTGVPSAFIVRRDSWHLILDGRSPMEEIEVPAFVPKKETAFYRDALIASHGGKTLAGLFYLRTFIEQFARRVTGFQDRKATGEEIMSAYSATLPDKVRDTMPSLGDLYERLSAALHTASSDDELFTTALEKINHHFDIRRVHRMSERRPLAKPPN